MEAGSIASRHTGSTLTRAPSALDPSFLQVMSISSDWYFKPEGVKLVMEKFEKEMSILEQRQGCEYQVSPEWVPRDAMFLVRCAKVDYKRIYRALMNALTAVIKEATYAAHRSKEGNEDLSAEDEDADEDDDFVQDVPIESNLIQRLAVWQMQGDLVGPIAESESDGKLARTDTQLIPVLTQDESFPEEIRLYNFRQAWHCGDKNIILDDMLSEADLKELVRLTSCHFTKSINEGIVFVGTHEEDKLVLAVQKLNNIENNWQCRHPWVNHLFYDEETSNVKYVLKYFVDVKMFFFETTLLDNLQVVFSNGACDYEALINAATVRCAPYVPVKSEYVPIKKLNISAIKLEDIPGGVSVFLTAHTYCGKGNPSEDPMLHRPAQAPDPAPSETQQVQDDFESHLHSGTYLTSNDESVQRWATGVPDAFGADVTPTPSGVSNTVGSQASPRKADWDHYKEYKPTESDVIVKKELYWKNEKGVPLGAGSNVHPVSGLHLQVPAKNRMIPQPMSRSASMPQFASRSDGLVQPLQPMMLNQQPPRPAVPAHSQPQRQQLPVLQKGPPGHSWAASQTTTVPPGSRRLFSESVARRSHVEMSLLDEDDPLIDSFQVGILEPVPRGMILHHEGEQEQLAREPDSRVFHQTMNQRAPRPRINPFAGRLDLPYSRPKPVVSSTSPTAGPTDPLPDFVGEINRSFKELMTGLRGYHGKVVVQAELGRIICGRFHSKHLSVKSKDHLLEGPYLQKIMIVPTEYGPTVDFTSALTAMPADVQYMVNMKGKGGQNIWEMNNVSRWHITYEFVFTDSLDLLHPVMIEIDAETFVARIKARRCLGNLFIHATKRHWDAKVAAIGFGNKRALEDRYGDLATNLQSSLYIPPGSHRPYLSWQLDESLHTQFHIEEVTVRRVYEYKSTDHCSVLKVSEVQSLDIDGGTVPEKSFWIFEAEPGNPDRPPIDKLTTWYEASITSTKLDTALEQNECLDLGDETVWTLDDIANMEASKALYSPALEMLQQMDGVGQHNHNGSDYRSRAPAAHHIQAKAEPSVDYW